MTTDILWTTDDCKPIVEVGEQRIKFSITFISFHKHEVYEHSVYQQLFNYYYYYCFFFIPAFFKMTLPAAGGRLRLEQKRLDAHCFSAFLQVVIATALSSAPNLS